MRGSSEICDSSVFLNLKEMSAELIFIHSKIFPSTVEPQYNEEPKYVHCNEYQGSFP